jgi:TolB protein
MTRRAQAALVASLLVAGCASAAPSQVPTVTVVPTLAATPSATASIGPSLPALASPSASASTIPDLQGTILYTRIDDSSTIGHLFLVHSLGVTRPITKPGATCCLVWAPDGSAILMPASAPGSRITTATMAPDGSAYRVLPLNDPTLSLGPGAWSPDSSRIALEGWDDKHAGREGLYTERLDGSERQRLTLAPGGLHDLPVAWSPDGSRLLLVRAGATADRGALFVVGADGTGLRQLSPVTGSVIADFWSGRPASWAPDGHAVAFAAFTTPTGAEGLGAIYVADTASGAVHAIVDSTVWSTTASWSPTGDSIVFDKRAAPTSTVNLLFLVHPDGSGLAPVPGGDTGVCCAIWSPDGRQLLYARGGDTRHLIVANVDGSGSTVLTPDAAEWGWYGWVR